MNLSSVLKGVHGSLVSGNDNIEIKGIAYDSRKVIEGYAFVCIKGYKEDGHDYIESACKNGASVIIISESIDTSKLHGITIIKVNDTRKALSLMSINFYNNPRDSFKLIGITGTNGKTTTTYLVKSILEMSGYKVGLIGTNQNLIGSEVIPSERTTPESLELQQLFSKMKDSGASYVVMEVSSHSLSLDRVHGITFDVGVWTNMTQDHLDFHGDMESYFLAKEILFKNSKVSVINTDDEYGNRLYHSLKTEKVSYGINENAKIRATEINMASRGVKFNAPLNDVPAALRVSIPGKFSVYNALAAAIACSKIGIDNDTIEKGLIIAKTVKGRAEVVHINTNFTVLIDYAHTPDGLSNIIETVKEYATGRVITMFGCGGDRDKSKRHIMGKIAGDLSDFVIITSDNPRSEEPMDIINEIKVGVDSSGCDYKIIENRRKAIEFALRMAEKDDFIILAGKGHETYQILKDRTIDFDEKAIVEEIAQTLEGGVAQ